MAQTMWAVAMMLVHLGLLTRAARPRRLVSLAPSSPARGSPWRMGRARRRVVRRCRILTSRGAAIRMIFALVSLALASSP